MADGEISFGRFRLDSARRELRRGDERVQLGGRALDILRVLASAEGAVVSKDELMAHPDHQLYLLGLADVLGLLRECSVPQLPLLLHSILPGGSCL